MFIVLSRAASHVSAQTVDDEGNPVGRARPVASLAGEVGRAARTSSNRDSPRWVWDDTSTWYPALLAAGVRVERCIDLRLCHAILRASALTASSALARAGANRWDAPPPEPSPVGGALFDVEADGISDPPDPLGEFKLQRDAVLESAEPARIQLLLTAESAGALAAAEMRFAGLPWNVERHSGLLEELLGPRPADGQRPVRMREALERVRQALDSPDLNPDSPPELLRALRRAGIRADSTRSGELKRFEHPAIPPLLNYKRLARLMSANGWNWLDANVSAGRFRPDYVPGGVVTGRWASKGGGGALQLPKQVRGAVLADAGWKLVVADAAQLEPRILAALAGDRGMAEAGSAGDLYAGIVASGAVDTRANAKIAMLGAMYGATSGEAGRLLPRLARAYPRAIAFVENAARAGERGDVVTTRLGRTSPPGAVAEYDETATEEDQSRSRTRARSWGRFTRNFVVQGTAAEWALCWIAGLRVRLAVLGGGAALPESPHLVFFLHDEVVVHTPAEFAARVEEEVRAAAEDAGRLLFGDLPVAFPVTVTTVDDYGQAT